MGIYPPTEYNAINKRILTILFAVFLLFVSTTGEFLFKKSSIIQQAQSFVILISIFACLFNILTCIWEMGNVFNLIEKLEVFIVKSTSLKGEKQIVFCTKFHIHVYFFLCLIKLGSSDLDAKIMYIQLNEKIEQMCQWIYFGLMKLTYPLVMLPSAIVTAINYFAYDLNNDDTFYLSSPLM